MAYNDTHGQIFVKDINISLQNQPVIDDPAAQQRSATENARLTSLFGVDLYMFAEGDLFVNNTQGDLKLVGSVYNYAQAITHRLMTSRGTHPVDSTFGVPWLNYLGKSYTSSTTVLTNLRQDITDELYKDNRTQKVVQVITKLVDPTIIDVTTVVLPIGVNQSTLSINLTVGVS